MKDSNKIRIAIVEDHKMFRQSLKICLEQIGDFKVVEEAECGAEFEKKYHPDKIDIILMDLRLKGQHGKVTTQNLIKKFPRIKIIILSSFDDREVIIDMITNGVVGYISKSEEIDVIEETIRGVMKRGFHFHKDIGALFTSEVSKAMQRHGAGHPFVFNGVTYCEKELELGTHICNQLSHVEIAKIMNISERTIEGYKKTMKEKSISDNFYGVIVHLFKYHHLYPQDMKSDVALRSNK